METNKERSLFIGGGGGHRREMFFFVTILLIPLFANLCTTVALSYYGLMYMQHAIYHFKAYNIIYTNIITDDLQGKNLNV
jgi:hypothetical protein